MRRNLIIVGIIVAIAAFVLLVIALNGLTPGASYG
jgi:hypothetical protein